MRRMIAASTLALVAIPSCLTPNVTTPIQHSARFVETEYAPYRRAGTARLIGEAFVRTPEGEAKMGSGCAVHVDPVSSYSTEWFDLAVLNRIAIGLDDPSVQEFRRTVRADSRGAFVVEGLPPGEYYVTCPIYWTEQRYLGSVSTPVFGSIHTAPRYDTVRVGGTAYARVKVEQDRDARVVLAW